MIPPPSPADGSPDGPRPWTEVGDREELRRRLESLLGDGDLAGADVEFVLFFFRASDPVLYPLAATVLGRRLDRSPELREWLRDYAGRRGIPVGGAVPLTGSRSHRRVLLAAAAAAASRPATWTGLAPPGLEKGDPPRLAPLPDEAPVERAQDLAAYLRALRLLLEGRSAGEGHETRAAEVLRAVAGETDLLADRSVSLRWAELLAEGVRKEGGPDRGEASDLAKGVLGDLRRGFTDPERRGVGRRLAVLRGMDGVVRGSGDLVPVADRPPGLPGIGGFSGDEPELRSGLAEALGDLEDSRRWWSLGEAERAWKAFFLLDLPGRSRFPFRELEGLLDAFGLPPGRRPAARVLRLLGEREGTGPAEFVDAELLHALEDEDILLDLVPSGPPGELGAVVVDALEHRIRVALVTEPGFRPDELLARIEVRRPHPLFLRLFRTLIRDREYFGPEGEPIPLADWMAAVQDEAQLLHGEGPGRIGEDPPVPGAVAEIRRGVRRGFLRLEGVDDPLELLRELETVLEGGRVGDGSGRPRDVRALLFALAPGRAEGLDAPLRDHARILREEGPQAIPGTLEEIPQARASLAAVRGSLRFLADHLSAHLPASEATLLEGALGHADRVEAEWLSALSEVEDAWTGGRGAGLTGESRWSPLLDAVTRVPAASHRRRLHPVLWRTLVRESGGMVPATEGSERVPTVFGRHGRKETLMRWAVRVGEALPDEGDRASWLGSVADHWSGIMEEGMEKGLETRVARLIRDPGPRALSLLPGVDGVLERMRVWFFDCYRLWDAARVSRILNHRRGRGAVAALPRDLLAFFLHYGALWLAILVGAILMLDFGDAWTAMAELGDVRGIGITFSLGVLGAFGYVVAELHTRVRDAPGDRRWTNRGARILRALAFVAVSLLYTVALVSLLWWLLSGTDEVVHGEGAVLHVVVWSGFALFIGVFFGLLAKGSA